MPALEKIQFDMDLGEPILDMTGDAILDMSGDAIFDTQGWVEISDVLDDPITIKRGNFDGLPIGRVAETGTADLILDNSRNNSARLEGYYSPDHANARCGFEKGRRFRIGLKRTGLPIYYKFAGKILDINPAPGLLNRKVTKITVVDWMDVAARTPMPRLAVLAHQRDDQALQALLNALDEKPDSTSLAIGAYAYGYVFTDLQDENDKALAAMQSLAASGLGRFAMKGGTISGEVLTFDDPYTLVDPSRPVLISLANAFLDLPGLGRKAYKRIKRVHGTVYPLEHDGAPVVLYSLPQSIRIGPGGTAEFRIYYRDTAGSKNRIAVTSVENLVADTDYKFSSTDGSGNDMNGSLAITMDKGGNSVGLKFTNASVTTTGYLWLMQVRGTGVYRTNSVTYTAVDDTISDAEGIALDLRLPYQSDYNVAADISTAMLGWLDVEATEVPTVEIGANITAELLDAVVEGEPGDLIDVVDDVSGVSSRFAMLGYELTINFVGDIRCRWYLAYAIQVSTVLTLNQDGMDALNTDEARLGF